MASTFLKVAILGALSILVACKATHKPASDAKDFQSIEIDESGQTATIICREGFVHIDESGQEQVQVTVPYPEIEQLRLQQLQRLYCTEERAGGGDRGNYLVKVKCVESRGGRGLSTIRVSLIFENGTVIEEDLRDLRLTESLCQRYTAPFPDSIRNPALNSAIVVCGIVNTGRLWFIHITPYAIVKSYVTADNHEACHRQAELVGSRYLKANSSGDRSSIVSFFCNHDARMYPIIGTVSGRGPNLELISGHQNKYMTAGRNGSIRSSVCEDVAKKLIDKRERFDQERKVFACNVNRILMGWTFKPGQTIEETRERYHRESECLEAAEERNEISWG